MDPAVLFTLQVGSKNAKIYIRKTGKKHFVSDASSKTHVYTMHFTHKLFYNEKYAFYTSNWL